MISLRKSLSCVLAAIVFIPAVYDDECHTKTPFKERIHFNIGVGYGNYNMKRAEVRLLPPDEFIYYEYPFKRIEGGREFYGEITFECTRNISFGCGILYSSGNRDLSEWYRGLFNDYNYRRPRPRLYEASVIAPYLKARYKSVFNNLDYSIDGSLYYGFGSLYTNLMTSFFPLDYKSVTLKSEGFGYSLSLGLSFELAGGFSVENAFGYRNLVTGELEAPDGNKLENSNLNFNGYFIRGGISVNPWSK